VIESSAPAKVTFTFAPLVIATSGDPHADHHPTPSRGGRSQRRRRWPTREAACHNRRCPQPISARPMRTKVMIAWCSSGLRADVAQKKYPQAEAKASRESTRVIARSGHANRQGHGQGATPTSAPADKLLLLIKRPVEPRGSPQSRLGLTSITAKQSLMIEADQAYHRDYAITIAAHRQIRWSG